jgi:hypothetical protein
MLCYRVMGEEIREKEFVHGAQEHRRIVSVGRWSWL